MSTKTTIMVATAIVLGMASGAVAQNSTLWDNPPGAAWQDRGIIVEQGEAAVLTSRGYRPYRPHDGAPMAAYAFAPQTPKQAVKSPREFERIWFRLAEGPEWN